MTTANNPFAAARTATPPAQDAAWPQEPAAQKATEPDAFAPAGAAAPDGDPFATPAGPGSGEKITDFEGHLLLVTPTEHVEGMDTSIGKSDVVRADMVVLDGDRPGYEVPDILVFQTALRRDLLRVLNGTAPMMLGRLGRGTAKQGKSAPWIFAPPTDEDKTLARQYLEARG